MPKKKTDTQATTDTIVNERKPEAVTPARTFGDSVSELVDDDKNQNTKRPVHVRVSVRQGESIEQMLRRFNFAVTKSDVIQKMKDAQFFEKPSKRRQREEKMRLQQIRKYDN
ncbi:30S ribosomal protein S21 [candidate division WWE3 bacterium]|nr:30S ribosomal protein S21 [candidate division WWE3 bacterium]